MKLHGCREGDFSPNWISSGFADDTTGINYRWMGNYQFINLILARRNRGNISGGESEVRRTVLDELQDGR